MKVADMRSLNVSELRKEYVDSLQEQFKMRMQATSGQATRPHLFKQLRRKIAQLLTIINEKQSAGNA